MSVGITLAFVVGLSVWGEAALRKYRFSSDMTVERESCGKEEAGQ